MKNIWKILSPLKDEQMTEYMLLILKPFNITDPKVLGIGGVTFITTFLSHLTNFSNNYLGISVRFSSMLLILVIVDHVTGTLCAIKGKEKLTSKVGRRTIYKTGAYIFFIYVGYSLHTEINESNTLFIEVLRYFHPFLLIHITFWELFSVDENLKKLGVNFGMTDLLKSVYAKIKNIFDNVGKPKE